MNTLTKTLGQLECWWHDEHLFSKPHEELEYKEFLGTQKTGRWIKRCSRCGTVRPVKCRKQS